MKSSPLVYVVMANDMPQCVFDTIEVARDFCFKRTQENLSRKPPVFWQVYEFKMQSKDSET